MVLPHTNPPSEYNSVSEVRDLVSHMEKVAVGIKSGLYKPSDADFQDLSVQLFSLASQLRTFVNEKQQLVTSESMY